ncbi:outer membrane transport energization protein TonB [Arsukibacterium tuosuense]|uniref:Protein TonB n=1 Tax=Arsukibacterium tuosuense TaxID=1323745 RepID=A0A285IUX1_9GAMM|nr:energy transducer TonB [Arsukibacterium tuosuense]SNY51784.1 outer membrane transport energization protein TonB [Arsukibacterium tuosuense]
MQNISYANPFTTLNRMISSMLLAALVTFSLFAIMYLLIKPPLAERPIVTALPIVELFINPEDPPVVVKPLPTPPPPVVPPEQAPRTPVEVTNVVTPGPGFTITPPQLKTDLSSFGSDMDKTATPVVRVEPRFPVEALRDGISGWVKLRFSIDESGSVTDVEVLQAEPRGVFDREAARALRRWKYQPQVIDGKAIRQTNLQVVLDFTVDAG